MAGEVLLRKNQYGKETTKGTGVAATKRWLGTVAMPTDRKIQYPEDVLGLRAKAARAVNYQILADPIRLNAEHGYFQALPMLFSCFMKGGLTANPVTPTKTDYLWDFTPSLTGDNTQDSITLECGDDTQAYEMEYVLFRRIGISGQIGQDAPVKIEAEGFGKQVTPTTFTSSINVLAVEPMVANLAQLYIDSTWAGLGGTKKSSLLREFSVELLNGCHPKFYGDAKTMSSHGYGAFEALVQLVLEGNSDADTIFDAYRAQTEYALRLQINGSTIVDTTSTHYLKMDFWGTFESVEPMAQEADGNSLHVATFHAYYGLTGTSILDVNVVTTVNTI